MAENTLTVLTPTGGRPESFAKCAAMMMAQDFQGPVLWIIVDDCDPHTPITFKRGDWTMYAIRPQPRWQPGQNTHNRNLIAGLERCGDRVVMVEDDDYYGPKWLSMCNRWLDDHDAVGEAPGLYRHINGSERMMHNKTPSLCATAFKGEWMRKWLIEVCRTHKTAVDVHFWRGLDSLGGIHPHSGEQIGIKGQPGRPGIGVGHETRIYR